MPFGTRGKRRLWLISVNSFVPVRRRFMIDGPLGVPLARDRLRSQPALCTLRSVPHLESRRAAGVSVPFPLRLLLIKNQKIKAWTSPSIFTPTLRKN